MKLEQAISMLQDIFRQDVIHISFEDGSGYKFNYRLKGQTKNHFINFKNIRCKMSEKIK